MSDDAHVGPHAGRVVCIMHILVLSCYMYISFESRHWCDEGIGSNLPVEKLIHGESSGMNDFLADAMKK